MSPPDRLFYCTLIPEIRKELIGNKMKQTIFFITLLLATLTSSAQHTNSNIDRHRQYAGRYGGNSGICLFEDGGFMLYGYATAVFGHYNFEKDYLLFFPDQPELFEVYARYNKELGDSTRICFAGFEEGKTFVQFNKEKLQRVFNEDANCFDAPFVYQAAQKLTSFTLSFRRENVWWDLGKPNPSWQYGVANHYNDFIWMFNEPRQEYENFEARLKTAAGKKTLQLSNYGGDEGFIKQVPDKEEQKQWEEILELKNQYDQSKRAGSATIFTNQHYRLFPKPDSLHYIWDQTSNQYISREADANEAYFRSNQYQDDRFLRKYIKLAAQNKDTANFTGDDVADKSIFYTVCGEGTRPSYHYEGFVVYEKEEENEITPLIATVPAPPLAVTPNKIADQESIPDSIKKSNSDEIVSLVKPFAVNRADGFYVIEKKSSTDYTQTILAAKASLSSKDFGSVAYTTGSNNESIILIRFNKAGAAKLEKFSASQQGKQVALVVDLQVVVMPFIAAPISNGSIHINWGFPSEQGKAIVERLQNRK